MYKHTCMITQLAYKQSVTECVTECVTVCVTECVTACVTECLSKACLFLLTTKSNITNYTNKTTHNHKYKTTNMIVLFLLLTNKQKQTQNRRPRASQAHSLCKKINVSQGI